VGVDKSYVIYDLHKGEVLTQIYTDAGSLTHTILLPTHTNYFTELTTVAFHPDGHLLAAGTTAGTIKLFDIKSAQTLHTFAAPNSPATAVQALSFSENGTWLASGNINSAMLQIWDLRKTALLKAIDVGTAVTGLAWDYTGQFLAACGPGGVVVNQYVKSSKAWQEPLRKAVMAMDLAWGAGARNLVLLDWEGTVSVLGA
jgi:pre-mRNA-processing factor 19